MCVFLCLQTCQVNPMQLALIPTVMLNKNWHAGSVSKCDITSLDSAQRHWAIWLQWLHVVVDKAGFDWESRHHCLMWTRVSWLEGRFGRQSHLQMFRHPHKATQKQVSSSHFSRRKKLRSAMAHHAGMQCGDEQTHIFLCSTHSPSTICSVGSTQQTAWNQQSLTVTIFALASACSALLVDEHCWFFHSFVTSLPPLDCMFTAFSCSSQDVCHFDVPAGYLASKKLHSTSVWCLSKFYSSVCLSVSLSVAWAACDMRIMSQWLPIPLEECHSGNSQGGKSELWCHCRQCFVRKKLRGKMR